MRERNRNEVALHNKMCDMVIVKEKRYERKIMRHDNCKRKCGE